MLVSLTVILLLGLALQHFNSKTCQLVLGAGAVEAVGLKTITARHLGETQSPLLTFWFPNIQPYNLTVTWYHGDGKYTGESPIMYIIDLSAMFSVCVSFPCRSPGVPVPASRDAPDSRHQETLSAEASNQATHSTDAV